MIVQEMGVLFMFERESIKYMLINQAFASALLPLDLFSDVAFVLDCTKHFFTGYIDAYGLFAVLIFVVNCINNVYCRFRGHETWKSSKTLLDHLVYYRLLLIRTI